MIEAPPVINFQTSTNTFFHNELSSSTGVTCYRPSLINQFRQTRRVRNVHPFERSSLGLNRSFGQKNRQAVRLDSGQLFLDNLVLSTELIM